MKSKDPDLRVTGADWFTLLGILLFINMWFTLPGVGLFIGLFGEWKMVLGIPFIWLGLYLSYGFYTEIIPWWKH